MTEMVSGERCWLFEMFRAGGGVFCFEERLWMRWGDVAGTYVVIEICGNGYPQELVGWENGMVTGKLMKMGLKKCFCVEAFV